MVVGASVAGVLLFWASVSFALRRLVIRRGIDLGRYMYPAAAVMAAVNAIVHVARGEWVSACAWVALAVIFASLSLAQRAKARELSTPA